MTERARLWLVETAMLCLMCVSASAQEPTIVSDFPPTTFAEALRSLGIYDQSEKSLIAALGSSNPEVRSLAANKLAGDGRSDAVGSIEAALGVEKDLNTQANIAGALVALHDTKGAEYLRSMCSNPSMPLSGVIAATRMLQTVQSPTGFCSETLLAALNQKQEAGDAATAVSLLPGVYRSVSQDQARRIIDVLKSLLNEQNPAAVRLEAGYGLAQIGSSESIEAVREAIMKEPDPTVRFGLESDLKTVQKKP